MVLWAKNGAFLYSQLAYSLILQIFFAIGGTNRSPGAGSSPPDIPLAITIEGTAQNPTSITMRTQIVSVILPVGIHSDYESIL